MVSVRVGHAHLSCALDVKIESMLAHPTYTRTNFGPINDIGLIKLSEHLNFSKTITPICLPKNHDEVVLSDPQKTLLTVAGWGRNEKATTTDKLLKVVLDYKKSAICEAEFQKKVST